MFLCRDDLDSITVICDDTVMVTQHSQSWSLEELLVEVTRQVESFGLDQAQQDNRVSALPDVRTIRYYTTLGLLDRPQIEGRQGRYGRKHLLQLVAVKAMQVLSLPLAEIQSRLYALTDGELEAVITSVSSRLKDAGVSGDRARPVVWREMVIQPGLKLMAEDGWSAGDDLTTIETQIRAALKILSAQPRKMNGGSSDDQSGKR